MDGSDCRESWPLWVPEGRPVWWAETTEKVLPFRRCCLRQREENSSWPLFSFHTCHFRNLLIGNKLGRELENIICRHQNRTGGGGKLRQGDPWPHVYMIFTPPSQIWDIVYYLPTRQTCTTKVHCLVWVRLFPGVGSEERCFFPRTDEMGFSGGGWR